MIILSRHDKEAFTITTPNGEKIEIQVLQCDDKKTRFGVDAPIGYFVERNEMIETNFNESQPRFSHTG